MNNFFLIFFFFRKTFLQKLFSQNVFWIDCETGKHLVAMNPQAENSCAVRRGKLSKQTAPRKSEKKFSKTNSITDPECS